MRKRDYADNSASSSGNFGKKQQDISLKKVKETEAMMKASTDKKRKPPQDEEQHEEVEEAPMTFEN